jgi:hypothetical protein
MREENETGSGGLIVLAFVVAIVIGTLAVIATQGTSTEPDWAAVEAIE